MCHAGGDQLQREFVLEAEHPRYCLRLADGTTIDISVTPAYLIPAYPSGKFAPDSNDSFKELRLDHLVKIGSFGLVIDAQRDSLRRIRASKEFAKAVKSDDAHVSVYLRNRRIGGWLSKEESEEKRDRALRGFQVMGWKLFM